MLDQILSFIFLYKYFALFTICFFASLTNLLPASASLIASGSLIAKGYFNYYQVFLFAYLGAVLGDIALYVLSYYFSKEILIRFGFRRLINSRTFIKAEKLFEKNAGKTIFISRFFLSTFGPVINLISGFAKVNYKKFILYDVLGEAIYVFLYTGMGYLFMNNWKHILKIIDYINNIFIIIILLFIVIYIYKKKIIEMLKNIF